MVLFDRDDILDQWSSPFVFRFTDIDDCDPNPCQNGWICTDGINGHYCNIESDDENTGSKSPKGMLFFN